MSPIRVLVLVTLMFAGNSFAAGSAVEGVIRDANGRPIVGVDVRVEARTGSWHKVVKSDARGHYACDGLTPGGTYRVTLIINGAPKASINNALAKSGPIQLNFDLRNSSVSGNPSATEKGKHYVYVPAETGAHLGGRWVAVDENGQADPVWGTNVARDNPERLRKSQSNRGS